MHQLVEPGSQPVVGDPDRASEPAQARRCRVGHLAGWVEAAVQDAPEARLRVDLARQVAQKGPAVAAERLAKTGRAFQGLGDVQEVARLQATAPNRALDPRQDVFAAADAGAGMLSHE